MRNILYYYTLECCLFSKGRQKGSRCEWDRRCGGTGSNRGREN